jgi:hypothetical protein
MLTIVLTKKNRKIYNNGSKFCLSKHFLVLNSIKSIYIGGIGAASGSALNSYPHQSLEMCNTVNTGYGLSISQSALPEVSPAGEAGHAGNGAFSIKHEGLLYMPVAQQCRPEQYFLMYGNCKISQKNKRSGIRKNLSTDYLLPG